MCAWYTHKLRFVDAKYFDFGGYHPNVSGDRIKSDKKALAYVSKECPIDLLVQYNMDIKEEQAARTSHKRLIGKRILEEGIDKVMEECPELCYDYKRIKQNIQEWERDKEPAYKSDGVRGVWYWGPPCSGKSHAARTIAKEKYNEDPYEKH